MIVIEVIAVFYSFGFVLWQTQIGPTFVSNTEDHYKLIVAICLVLALIWVFAFISCLVAYTYNAFLLFLIVANTIQTLLVPYVMFRLKREQFPITQNQTGNQSQEQANLLEELRIIRQKLEQHENQQFVKTGQSTTFSNQPSFDFDYNNPLRIPKVSFADQPNIY
jgi:Na+(H+)/acetate symporter ActP